jgi:hypothetical protein
MEQSTGMGVRQTHGVGGGVELEEGDLNVYASALRPEQGTGAPENASVFPAAHGQR